MVTKEMKTRIKTERLSTPLSETATDYEAMVYLHTASLAIPLSREWYNIYTFLFSKYHPEQAKRIGVYREQITKLEQHELRRLKNGSIGNKQPRSNSEIHKSFHEVD